MLTPWAEEYLLKRWTAHYDCRDLVLEVLRDRFGIDRTLPGSISDLRERARGILRLHCERVADPQPGDVVAMVPRAAQAGSGAAFGRSPASGAIEWHIGVFCVPSAGRPRILHLSRHFGARLDDPARIADLEMAVEGFYRPCA